MSALGTMQWQRTAWGRCVLCTFAIALLMIAIQPCTMALDDNGHHDSTHCPPPEAPSEEDTRPPCGMDIQTAPKPRTGTSKLNGFDQSPPIVALRLITVTSWSASHMQSPDVASALFASGHPPHNILFCVFLN